MLLMLLMLRMRAQIPRRAWHQVQSGRLFLNCFCLIYKPKKITSINYQYIHLTCTQLGINTTYLALAVVVKLSGSAES